MRWTLFVAGLVLTLASGCGKDPTPPSNVSPTPSQNVAQAANQPQPAEPPAKAPANEEPREQPPREPEREPAAPQPDALPSWELTSEGSPSLYAGQLGWCFVGITEIALPMTVAEPERAVCPEGLKFEIRAGAIQFSGTIRETGKHPFYFVIQDGNGKKGVLKGDLEVLPVGQRLPDYQFTAGVAGALYGDCLRFSMAGITDAQLLFDVAALPKGLTPKFGACGLTLIGQPKDAGEFTLKLTLRGGVEPAELETREYKLLVKPAGTVSILTRRLPAMSTRGEVIVPLLATGGNDTNGSKSWKLAAGELPPGIALEPSRFGLLATYHLAGTPNKAGKYTFTLQADDSSGASATREYTVEVSDGAECFGVPVTGETIFYVYCSAAMSGPLLDRVKQQLMDAIDALPDGTRIDLAADNTLDDSSKTCHEGLVELDADTRAISIEWIDKLESAKPSGNGRGSGRYGWANMAPLMYGRTARQLFVIAAHAPNNSHQFDETVVTVLGQLGAQDLACVSTGPSPMNEVRNMMWQASLAAQGVWVHGE